MKVLRSQPVGRKRAPILGKGDSRPPTVRISLGEAVEQINAKEAWWRTAWPRPPLGPLRGGLVIKAPPRPAAGDT